LTAMLLWVTPAAMGAPSRTHTVSVTAPAKLDFTLATVILRGTASGLHISVVGPADEEYVAAAAVRPERIPSATPPPPLPLGAFAAKGAGPTQILILVVNRQPPGSTAPEPGSVRARIQTRAVDAAPEFSQHVDILADGAPGQNCSALISSPTLGHPYIWGDQLEALTGSGGPFGVSETVARALDQACSDSIDTQFEGWVRQQPPPPHP
jgi:hypothetical protein